MFAAALISAHFPVAKARQAKLRIPWRAGFQAINQRGQMKKSSSRSEASPSRLIDARIAELADWRGETLSRVRRLIKRADPDVAEEWKWDVPVWSHNGVICTGETYKSVVKLTFLKGAQLKDPKRLFNSSLEGNARRAIDLREQDEIDESAFLALIREAVALNVSGAKRKGHP